MSEAEAKFNRLLSVDAIEQALPEFSVKDFNPSELPMEQALLLERLKFEDEAEYTQVQSGNWYLSTQRNRQKLREDTNGFVKSVDTFWFYTARESRNSALVPEQLGSLHEFMMRSKQR